MHKRYISPVIASTLLSLPLLSQADYGYNLTRHRGGKIVLLGDWKPADIAKWRQVIDSDGIFEYGFILLDRNMVMDGNGLDARYIITDRNINAFEGWIRQTYGISAGVRWVALDAGNNLGAFGGDVPNANELDKLLEQRGVKSPLRMVRDFLAENPGHLEAKADLLVEARRRALQKMPPNVTEDLDTESDLRIWGVLAAETDRVFSGSWVGVDLKFFAPHKDQPEKYSKLMRAVFHKHISKIESAIMSDPANSSLWNIWAWMARSAIGYNWNTFINPIEPFSFPTYGTTVISPTADVCLWIVNESMAKKDWDIVIKYAPMARGFIHDAPSTGVFFEWMPGGMRGMGSYINNTIEGYPAKSAYAPHLEALLRLGRIEEANNVFDEMIRLEGKIDTRMRTLEGKRFQNGTNNALIAANAARSVGMENIAKIWEQGELIKKETVYYWGTGKAYGTPIFYCLTLGGSKPPALAGSFSVM